MRLKEQLWKNLILKMEAQLDEAADGTSPKAPTPTPPSLNDISENDAPQVEERADVGKDPAPQVKERVDVGEDATLSDDDITAILKAMKPSSTKDQLLAHWMMCLTTSYPASPTRKSKRKMCLKEEPVGEKKTAKEVPLEQKKKRQIKKKEMNTVKEEPVQQKKKRQIKKKEMNTVKEE